MQVCALVESDTDIRLRLHDSVHWVQCVLSKSLQQHATINKVFKIGDIVEVVTTKGAPNNLHAVSGLWLLFWYRVVFF